MFASDHYELRTVILHPRVSCIAAVSSASDIWKRITGPSYDPLSSNYSARIDPSDHESAIFNLTKPDTTDQRINRCVLTLKNEDALKQMSDANNKVIMLTKQRSQVFEEIVDSIVQWFPTFRIWRPLLEQAMRKRPQYILYSFFIQQITSYDEYF